MGLSPGISCPVWVALPCSALAPNVFYRERRVMESEVHWERRGWWFCRGPAAYDIPTAQAWCDQLAQGVTQCLTAWPQGNWCQFQKRENLCPKCVFARISTGLSLKIVGQENLKCVYSLFPWARPFWVSRVIDAAAVHAHGLARLGMHLAQGLVSDSWHWCKTHKFCNFSVC